VDEGKIRAPPFEAIKLDLNDLADPKTGSALGAAAPTQRDTS